MISLMYVNNVEQSNNKSLSEKPQDLHSKTEKNLNLL